MVFRCNMDGSEFETLGLELPQQLGSGRRFVRHACGSPTTTTTATEACASTIVMEFGNYGYKDEFTGAGVAVSRAPAGVTRFRCAIGI